MNINTETPMEVVATPPTQSIANIQRQMLQGLGIQANTPSAIATELSRRHAPVISTPVVASVSTPTPPQKKPGFFNRLFGRTRKNTSGEKKPGFFNRLLGRTKKVAPTQIQTPKISTPPSPPSLQPATPPPSPPTVSQPSTPTLGPPPPIRIPTRFNLEPNINVMTNYNYSTTLTEEYSECVMRVAWYLKQRLDGKTHIQLIPYLDRPGTMILSQSEYDALKKKLTPLWSILDTEGETNEFTTLKEQLFGPRIDDEENTFEKGQRLTSQNTKKYCPRGTCLLYKDTPQQVFAHGNVGNGIARFLPNLFLEKEFVEYRSNIARASFCSPGMDCYYVGTKLAQVEQGAFADPSTGNLLQWNNPNLKLIFLGPSISKSVGKIGAPLEYEYFLTMRFIVDAFVNQQVYFISPLLAIKIMEDYPDLFSAAFGSAIRWNTLSRPVFIRMLALQYYTAVHLAIQTQDPSLAQKVFETYPQPALGLLQGFSRDTLTDFSTYFRNVQKLAGIRPILLRDYVLQLKKLKNIQIAKTVRRNLPKNTVQNWTGKTKKTANNLRRNAAKAAILEAQLKNKTIPSYEDRISGVAPNYKMPTIQTSAKTQKQLKQTLNTGFGTTQSVIPPSAYEAIVNWK